MPISPLHLIALLAALSLVVRPSSAEMFSSLVDLGKILEAERVLYEALIRYTVVEQSRLSRVDQLAREIIEHYNSVKNVEREEFFSNPVSTYLLIKKFVQNWKAEINQLVDERGQPGLELQRQITELEDQNLPTTEDLKGSIDAILRLQNTYNLDTQMMADGLLDPNQRSQPLSAEECFYIGYHSYIQDSYHAAQLWLTEAMRRMSPEFLSLNQHTRSSQAVNLTTILDYLAFSLYKDNEVFRAAEVTSKLLEIDPNHDRAVANMQYFEELLTNQDSLAKPVNEPTEFEQEQERYKTLCRNEDIMPYEHAHLLHCRYYVPHPFYLIGPIKEEIAYFDPRIVLWHDVISESEIRAIQELSKPRLRRATVQNSITGKLETAPYRVSKSSWLPRDLDSVTQIINRKIETMTGLNLDTAEDLQVVNYGVGGQYEPHFDFARRREKTAFEKQVGNRIATLIYYLSDVQSGGLTVFTDIGVRLRPVRRAAAFWFNLLPSGEGDLSTRHAACPVLLGSKWVMNKWFHERGQELARPCMLDEFGLDYDDRYRIKRVRDVVA